MRGICIRRWKPRCIVPRASATNSACSFRSGHFRRSRHSWHRLEAVLLARSLSDQGAVAADRFSFRYGARGLSCCCPDQQDQAVVVAGDYRFAALGCLLHRTGVEPERARQMGLATFPHDAPDPHDIIRQADEMIMWSKRDPETSAWLARVDGKRIAASSPSGKSD